VANSKLSVSALGVLAFGLATAGIHLIQPDLILKLNGLGYIVLLGIIALPIIRLKRYRESARQGLLLYTIVTIMMYFLVHQTAAFEQTLGLISKGLEAALVLFLMLDLQRVSKTKNHYRF